MRAGADAGRCHRLLRAACRDIRLTALLTEQGLEAEDEVVLRRVLTKDGRSRAFINDQPVGVALLRRAAALLVEVQGQHEQIGLADPASHAGLLDAFGVPRPLREAMVGGMARLARGGRGAGSGARSHRRGGTRRGVAAPRGR